MNNMGTETDKDYIGRGGTVASIMLGAGPNAPLASAPGLELHHPIVSMLGGSRDRLERDRYKL